MKRMNGKGIRQLIRGVLVLVGFTLCFPVVPGFRTLAQASDTGAFLGGMVASHIIGGFVRRDRMRTAAEMDQAYSQRQMRQQPSPAPAPSPARSSQMTTEQKLQQLDKLASGGYITPQEYKARKKAILDGM